VSDSLTDLAVALGAMTARAYLATKTLVRVTGLQALGVMKREEPVDTGALRNSTRMIVDADGFGVAVGPTVEYASYVANGTRRMRPNPYDLRTSEQVGPDFKAGIEAIARDLM